MRILATTSCSLQILFSTFHPVGKVLWLPLRWNAFYVTVNAFYVARLVAERWIDLSAEERSIYTKFGFDEVMDESDFQRLIRRAHVETVSERTTVMVRGEPNEQLILLLDGAAELELGEEGVIVARRGAMLGEVSFLHDLPVSATVTLPAGCRYVRWDRAELGAGARFDAARRGLELAISRQLSLKLVRTTERLADLAAAADAAQPADVPAPARAPALAPASASSSAPAGSSVSAPASDAEAAPKRAKLKTFRTYMSLSLSPPPEPLPLAAAADE